MKTGTTVHASVAIFVSVAFLGMLVLGVSPKLHFLAEVVATFSAFFTTLNQRAQLLQTAPSGLLG